MKKTISLILSMLMLLSSLTLLASCGTGSDNEGADSVGASENATEGETLNAYEALTKIDGEGETFTILTRSDAHSNFYIESYGAEGNSLLDDLIYQRNEVIARDLNIVFDIIDGGDYTVVQQTVATQSTAGTDDYDMFLGHKSSFGGLALNNYLYNMAEIDTMDLTNPWWEKSALENLNVNGVIGLMSGDILPASLTISACMVFNKKLMREMGKTEPYEAVKQGKWTLDAFNALTADVTQDKNGDGKITIADDLYGFTSWYLNSPYSMFYAAGRTFVTINEDGEPELTYEQEDILNIYAKLYQGLIAQNSNFCTDIADHPMHAQMFKEGRALMIDTSIGALSGFSSDMEDDYGVLPEPKYDELQEEYYSFVNGAAPFIGINITESRPEFVGAVIEAMSAYNYTSVTPNMFEIVTKYRSTRDPQSAEMVDFIIRNRIFDFGYYFDLPVTNVVREQLAKKKAEIASGLHSADKSSQNSIKKILKAYDKINK